MTESRGSNSWILVALAVPVAAFVASRMSRNGGTSSGPGVGLVTSVVVPKPAVVNRGWIGIRVEKEATAVRIAEIFSGSPAEEAGLQVGDEIVSANGQPVTKELLNRLIGETDLGATITLGRRAPGAISVDAIAVRVDVSGGMDALTRQLIADGSRALAGLQMPDGFWPHFQSDPLAVVTRPGTATSALACAALAAAGDDADAPTKAALERGIEALLARRSPDGGLSDAREEIPHRVYANACLIMALAGADRQRWAREIETARDWLVNNQIDEKYAPWVDPLDNRYGAWNYYEEHSPLTTRADVSVAAFALEALDVANLSSQSPVWRKAGTFLDRCQNREAHGGDPETRAAEAPWRDGGFAFGPRFSKAGISTVGRELVVYKSYGSSTADGLRGLLAAGGRDVRDERIDAALGWLARAHLLDKNPGFGDVDAVGWSRGIYYYYLAAFARGMNAAKVDRIRSRGVEHAWPEELTRFLANRLRRESSTWSSTSGLMGEDGPSVATALSVMALAAARDRILAHDGRTVDGGEGPPRPPPEPDAGFLTDASLAEQGRRLFQDKGRAGCTSCHQDDHIEQGPILVGVADRYLEWKRTRAEAAAYIHNHIRDPKQYPGMQTAARYKAVEMPRFSREAMSDAAVDTIVEFLLSRTGTKPVAVAGKID